MGPQGGLQKHMCLEDLGRGQGKRNTEGLRRATRKLSWSSTGCIPSLETGNRAQDTREPTGNSGLSSEQQGRTGQTLQAERPAGLQQYTDRNQRRD